MFPGAPAVPQQPHQAMLPAMCGGSHLAAVLRSAARQLSRLNGNAAAQPAARAVGAASAAAVRSSAQSANTNSNRCLGLSGGSAQLPSRLVLAVPPSSAAPATASAVGSQRGLHATAAARCKAASDESNSSSDAGTGSATAQVDPAAPPAAKRKRGRPRKQASKAVPATDSTPAERDALSSAGSSGAAPETIAAAAADAAANAGPSAPAPMGKAVRKRTNALPSAASAAAAAQPQPAAGQASEALFAAQPPAAATNAAQQQQPPPPDLDACVPLNPGPWAAVQRWVVFSDLHVAPRTAAVAVEVLRRVHAEAKARDAGVLFLGELWLCNLCEQDRKTALGGQCMHQSMDCMQWWCIFGSESRRRLRAGLQSFIETRTLCYIGSDIRFCAAAC